LITEVIEKHPKHLEHQIHYHWIMEISFTWQSWIWLNSRVKKKRLHKSYD